MIVDKRLYRTADGRLVGEGDPDAAFLAYPAGTEIPDTEAVKEGLLKKAAAKPADKAAPKPADKAAHAESESEPAPRRGPGRPRKE
jgi:hypothetical protein